MSIELQPHFANSGVTIVITHKRRTQMIDVDITELPKLIEMLRQFEQDIEMSSNGRTSGLGPENEGPNPSVSSTFHLQ